MNFLYVSDDFGVTWYDEDHFNLIVQPGNKNPLTPDTSEVLVNVAGKLGVIRFQSQIGGRSLVIPLALPFEDDQYNTQIKAREFARFWTDGKGRPKDIWLRFGYDPDVFYIVQKSTSLDIERDLMLGFLQLALFAAEPMKQLREYAADIDFDSEITWYHDIRFDDEFVFTMTGNTTVEVNNFGTLDVSPVIQIVGSFTTLNITIGDQTLIYSESLAAQTLTIDCAKFAAKVGITNKNNQVSGDWLELPVGVNEVAFAGTGMNFTVTFIFRPKFL